MMFGRERYEKLVTWQRAMDLVALVYRLVGAFPESEKSGLTASMKKAAASVPAKVAEASTAAHGDDPPGAVKACKAAQGALVELFNTALVARRVKVMGRGPLAKLRRACRRLDALIERDIQRLEALIEEQSQTEAEHADAAEPVPEPVAPPRPKRIMRLRITEAA